MPESVTHGQFVIAGRGHIPIGDLTVSLIVRRIIFIILIPVMDFLLWPFLPQENGQQHTYDGATEVTFP